MKCLHIIITLLFLHMATGIDAMGSDTLEEFSVSILRQGVEASNADGLNVELKDMNGHKTLLNNVGKGWYQCQNLPENVYWLLISDQTRLLDSIVIKASKAISTFKAELTSDNKCKLKYNGFKTLFLILTVREKTGLQLQDAQVDLVHLSSPLEFHFSGTTEYRMENFPEGTYSMVVRVAGETRYAGTINLFNSLHHEKYFTVILGKQKDYYMLHRGGISPYSLEPNLVMTIFSTDKQKAVWELVKKAGLEVPSYDKFVAFQAANDHQSYAIFRSKKNLPAMNSTLIKLLRESPDIGSSGPVVNTISDGYTIPHVLTNKIQVYLVSPNVSGVVEDFCKVHQLELKKTTDDYFILTTKPEVGYGIFELTELLNAMNNAVICASPLTK